MSGLFNPFAEQEAEQDRAFSFYSDPLAAYASAPRAAPGPRPPGPSPSPRPPSGSGRGRGAHDGTPQGGRTFGRGAPQPQQPVYGRGGRGGGGGGRWTPVPPAPYGGYDAQAQGWGPHGGWEQHQQYQQPPPAFGAGGRGAYGGPPPAHGGWRGGYSGGPRPNKWVRTEAPGAAGGPAPSPEQVPPPAAGMGRGQSYYGRGDGGGGGGGRGRGGGRGGRGGRGRGGVVAGGEGDGDVAPGAMQAYYKPSFSSDPWVALTPRPLQAGTPGPAGGEVSGRGLHAVDMRKLGGVSLAEIMGGMDSAAEEEQEALLDGPLGEVGGDEPPEEDEEEEGIGLGSSVVGEGPAADGGRLSEEGATDRPWH